MSASEAAAQVVELADAICVHLYGKGHSMHHTRRVIVEALIAADAGEMAQLLDKYRKAES
jgi:hypothetical protein